MVLTHMRCYGEYRDDRLCDMCRYVNPDIVKACKRKTEQIERGEIKW